MASVVMPQSDRDGSPLPLYAYKLSNKVYEQLKATVRAQILGILRSGADSIFAATFCMYAAETFRRYHAEGPWAWETVFTELGYDTPNYQTIHGWVAKGLQYFRRPLLQNRNGHREFLVTLACEGGLPLQLLRRENTHLSRYFRELLTVYHGQRHTRGCNATDLARQVAARYLPTSLRHEVVFKLSGDLIQAIVQLQEQAADATDPITSLDQTQPQWRDALPLPVEDTTVEALLRNLVGQARTLSQTERQHWRWRCFLVNQGDHWSIVQHLELPSTVTGASLRAWSEWDDPPVRLRVLLHTTEGIDVIALLTRLQGMGEQAVYRCEGVRRGRVRLLNNEATAGARLLLSCGNAEVELPMLGGQELGPLPWVFAERDAQWEWIGEGSVRSRDASVRILALDAGHCKVVEGTCAPLGGAPDLQRVLYEINGTAEWRHPDLGTCQIRCASQDASEGSFLLHGPRLPSVLNPHPPFLGMPDLYAIGRDDVPRRVVGATLEWRPMDAPESAWRTDAAACTGRVWLRYRDTSGTLRFAGISRSCQ
jgi:hypothetical protein